MGIQLPGVILHTKQVIRRQLLLLVKQHFSNQVLTALRRVRRGHFTIYIVGDDEEHKKRYVVPISYLKHPLFQDLLRQAAEEFGYDHGMNGLIVPCTEHYFLNLISHLHNS